MHDLRTFAQDDVAKDRKEGKHCWHSSLAIDGEEGHIIDLETIRQISDSNSIVVRMCYDYDLVASIYEALAQLIDMRLYSSRLWIEKIGHHCYGIHGAELIVLVTTSSAGLVV